MVHTSATLPSTTPTTDTPDILPDRVSLATAWRNHDDMPDCDRDCDQVGVLEFDWSARTVRAAASLPVQGRAHGLLAEDDGGFLAVAPGPLAGCCAATCRANW